MMMAVLSDLIDDFSSRRALRAGSFIVTFYGDVILPRGASVWIGNLIETCRLVGINESLSRTAVSRLVDGGQLNGIRDGRRSYYHLTRSAAAEFRLAARAIHSQGSTPEAAPWTLVRVNCDGASDAISALATRGFGVLGPKIVLKPGDAMQEVRGALGGSGFVAFTAPAAAVGMRSLAELAADTWDLGPMSNAYDAFCTRFRPLAAALDAGGPPEAAECLAARLLLVHDFRRIALKDPELPASALPDGWAGGPARLLFRDCYDRLTPIAERHVCSRFVDMKGALRPLSGDQRTTNAA